MFDLLHFFLSLHPHIPISLGFCAFACILASSYPYVHDCLSVSLHPYIPISSSSCTLACTSASIYPQIHVNLQNRCILASSYPQVFKCSLVSSNICILKSSYSYVIPVIIAFSHRHIHMAVSTCLYPRIVICILTSSYLQVHVPYLHSCILISSGLCVLVCNIITSHLYILRLVHSVWLLISSHLHNLASWDSTIRTCLESWNQTKSIAVILTCIYFHSTRMPYLVSIPEVLLAHSVGKVDI